MFCFRIALKLNLTYLFSSTCIYLYLSLSPSLARSLALCVCVRSFVRSLDQIIGNFHFVLRKSIGQNQQLLRGRYASNNILFYIGCSIYIYMRYNVLYFLCICHVISLSCAPVRPPFKWQLSMQTSSAAQARCIRYRMIYMAIYMHI